jgi:hypothetical protein
MKSCSARSIRIEKRNDAAWKLKLRPGYGGRGVLLTGHEGPDEIADLLDAIDQFDAAVEANGGDLFIDSPTPHHADRVEQPDNPAYVLPTRRPNEPVSSYIGRVVEAAKQL